MSKEFSLADRMLFAISPQLTQSRLVSPLFAEPVQSGYTAGLVLRLYIAWRRRTKAEKYAYVMAYSTLTVTRGLHVIWEVYVDSKYVIARRGFR